VGAGGDVGSDASASAATDALGAAEALAVVAGGGGALFATGGGAGCGAGCEDSLIARAPMKPSSAITAVTPTNVVACLRLTTGASTSGALSFFRRPARAESRRGASTGGVVVPPCEPSAARPAPDEGGFAAATLELDDGRATGMRDELEAGFVATDRDELDAGFVATELADEIGRFALDSEIGFMPDAEDAEMGLSMSRSGWKGTVFVTSPASSWTTKTPPRLAGMELSRRSRSFEEGGAIETPTTRRIVSTLARSSDFA
jgi:hypothetical protein